MVCHGHLKIQLTILPGLRVPQAETSPGRRVDDEMPLGHIHRALVALVIHKGPLDPRQVDPTLGPGRFPGFRGLMLCFGWPCEYRENSGL